MPCESLQLFAGFCVPDFNTITSTTGNCFSIMAKTYTGNPRSIPFKSLYCFPPVFCVPDLDAVIPTTAGDLLAILTETYAGNRRVMPCKSLHFFAIFCIPDFDAINSFFNVSLFTTAGDLLPIWAKSCCSYYTFLFIKKSY